MATKKVAVPTLADLAESGTPEDVLVLARDMFTRESAMTAGESVESATAYAQDALRVSVAAERAGQRASVYAAMAAYAAVKAGLLTDGPKGPDAAATVRDPREWGEAWITPKNPNGVKRNTVDMWIRAGEAFMEWNVDPETSEGRRLLGGLAQSADWNKARKDFREAIDAAREGTDIAPEKVAELATARIAEVRAEVEKKEAARKKEREDEKAAEAARVKAALADKNTSNGPDLPKSLADKRALGEALVANLRPSVAEEREVLESLAAAIAAALDGAADSAA